MAEVNQNPINPWEKLKSMRKQNAAAEEQWYEFSYVIRGNPQLSKDWNMLPDSRKTAIMQEKFGVNNAKEFFKADAAATWDEDKLHRLGGMYMLFNTDMDKIPEGHPLRAEVQTKFYKNFKKHHHSAKLEIEAEKRIREQEQADIVSAMERKEKLRLKTAKRVDKMRDNLTEEIIDDKLTRAEMMRGGRKERERIEVKRLEQAKTPEAEQGEPQKFGSFGDVKPIYDALDKQYPDNPERARLEGDAITHLRLNPAFHQSSGIGRQKRINGIMEGNEYVENMTPGQRIRFRYNLTNNDWVDEAHRDDFDARSADGFWENMANEGARGVHQLEQAWNSSVEMALNNNPAFFYQGTEADMARKAEDIKDIAESRAKMEKIPASHEAKAVYRGDATPEEYATWLAQTTYSSLVAYAPFMPATAAAGVGGPKAVALMAGLSSGILEYGPSIIDYLAEEGIDVTNPDELLKTFTTNDAMMRKAYDYASKRSIPIFVVDGLTALVGAKFGAAKGRTLRAAKRSGVKPPSDWWKKAGIAAIDAGGGGYGEYLSQQWTDGEITDLNGIIAEMAGEMPGTVAAYAGGRVSAARAGGTDVTGVGGIDLGGVGQELTDKPPAPTRDSAPAPSKFDMPTTNATVDKEDDLSMPPGMGQVQSAFYDALPDENKREVKAQATAEFERRMHDTLNRPEYSHITDESIADFPQNELEQIGREAFSETLDTYSEGYEPATEPQAEEKPAVKTPSKPAEPVPSTPAPEAQAPAAQATKRLTAGATNKRVQDASTLEELEAIEAEWQENGKPEVKSTPKKIEARRKQLELEAPAEIADEEFGPGVRQLKGTKPIKDMAEESFVRWTTPDGVEIEGQVRHDPDSNEVAIETTGGEFTYLDPDTDVGVLVDYTPPAKPEAKPTKKALPKFGNSDMTMADLINDYDREVGGDDPTVAEMHDYLTGVTTNTDRRTGEKVPTIGKDYVLDVTREQVKEAMAEVKANQPKPIEFKDVEPDEQTMTDEDKAISDALVTDQPVPTTTEVVEPEVETGPPVVAGVELKTRRDGTPKAVPMNKAAQAATTMEELDQIEEMENALEKPRASVLVSIEQGRKRLSPKKKAAIPKREPVPVTGPVVEAGPMRLGEDGRPIQMIEQVAPVSTETIDLGDGEQQVLHKNTIPGEGDWRITRLIDGEPESHDSFETYEEAKKRFDARREIARITPGGEPEGEEGGPVAKPKKKRKALGDKVVEAEERERAKAQKPKAVPKTKPDKKAKPSAKPADPSKSKDPKSQPPKPVEKEEARQQRPEKFSQDKNGATVLKGQYSLRQVIRYALDSDLSIDEKIEILRGVEQIYIADLDHGRRKRPDEAFEAAIDDALGPLEVGKESAEDFAEVKEAEKKKAEKDAKAKARAEKEALSAEQMEESMAAPWPWYREDPIEEELAYLPRLEDEDANSKLAVEVVNEIIDGWRKLNGINDHIDPTFVGQMLDEIAEKVDTRVGSPDFRDAVFDYLSGDEEAGRPSLIDESRTLRQFLAQEYPGSHTLKEARGAAKTIIGTGANTPVASYSKWLELGSIAAQDQEETRAAALEALSKRGDTLTVREQDKKKATPEEIEKVEAMSDDELGVKVVMAREGELAEVESSPTMLKTLEAERAKREKENPDKVWPDTPEDVIGQLEEKAKEDSDMPGWATGLERPIVVPDDHMIRKYFKKEWWPDAIRDGNALFLRHKDGETIIRFQLMSQAEILEQTAKEDDLKRHRKTLGLPDDAPREQVIARMNERAIIISSDIEIRKLNDRKKRGTLGYYGRQMNGSHLIAMDRGLSDEITLVHEAVHFALRNFFSDSELELSFAALRTEENIAKFFSLAIVDAKAARAFADSVAVQDDTMPFLEKMVEKIKNIYNNFSEYLADNGIILLGTPETHRGLAKIAERIHTGEIWQEVQDRPYIHHHERVGLATHRSTEGDVPLRTDRIATEPGLWERIKREAMEQKAVSDISVKDQVPNEPMPREEASDSRPRATAENENDAHHKAREKRRSKGIKARIKQAADPHAGVPPGLHKLKIEAERANSAGKTIGHAANNRMKKIVRDLGKVHGRERVSRSLAMVVDGRMPMSQFTGLFDIDPSDKALTSIQSVLDRQAKIREELAKSPNLSEDLRRQILANEFYQTRFYAAHILGDSYVADDGAFETVVQAIMRAHQDEVSRILDKVNEKAKDFNFSEFIEADAAREAEMLDGISKTRAEALIRLKRNLSPFFEAMDVIERADGRFVANWNADSLREVATETVEGYLYGATEKKKAVVGPLGGIPLANRMHRKLDVVFRDLYGEVMDPGQRMARTLEVQENLLATSTLFQKIFEEGRGSWWSPNRQGQFTKRLVHGDTGVGKTSPSDYRLFGKMAGQWVSQETYDMIMGEGLFSQEPMSAMMQHFQKIQAVTRGSRLLWWKTVARNALTSVSQFALGSGDMLNASWYGHMLSGIDLATRVVAGDPVALEQLAELVRQDIFDFSHDTMLQAVNANLEGIDLDYREPGTALGSVVKHPGKSYMQALKKLMMWYALIDLPTKYASYKVNAPKIGHEAAVEHVHKFYQYRDAVPSGITKLNRWGLGDYTGYTYDSTRIMGNQIIHAAKEALNGNPKPLFGLTLRLTIPLFRYGAGGALLHSFPSIAVELVAQGVWPNVLEHMLDGEKDDDDLWRVMTDKEMAALRNSLPSYDRGQPLAGWVERESKEDPWTLRYKVMGNISAFPFEDIVLGAWQASSHDPDRSFISELIKNVGRASPVTPGMTYNNLMTLLTGDESILEEGYKQEGVLDVLRDVGRAYESGSRVRSDWAEIIGKRVGQYAGDTIIPGQAWNMGMAMLEAKTGRDAGLAGRMVQTRTVEDAKDILTRLIRDKTIEKDVQLKVLGKMIRPFMESYDVEKRIAGRAGRADLKWEEGADRYELLMSEKGRDNWFYDLRRIQQQVEQFRTLTVGNFSDIEIGNYLKDRGLRSGEVKHIINGTVGKMTQEEFQFEHQPYRTQRGEDVMAEFWKTSNGPQYKTLYDKLKREKYAVGDYLSWKERRALLERSCALRAANNSAIVVAVLNTAI